MLPAAQGAALAQRELHSTGKWQGCEERSTPRTILIIGDGSFQMTVQELSTIIREKLNVLLVLINNDGYTIERCLHGCDQRYNDVASWKYLKTPALFGANPNAGKSTGYHASTCRVENWKELYAALDDYAGHAASDGSCFVMVEVMMGKEDAPAILQKALKEQKTAAEAVHGAQGAREYESM